MSSPGDKDGVSDVPRRRALVVFAALALAVVAVVVVVAVRVATRSDPPSGPVAGEAVLAATSADILRVAGSQWRPIEERDQPCEDSSPAYLEIDLRSSSQSMTDLRRALLAHGWKPAGTAVRRTINGADVALMLWQAGPTVTISASASNGLDDFCEGPAAPPSTFVPTPP